MVVLTMDHTGLTEQQLKDFFAQLEERKSAVEDQLQQIESSTEPVALDQQSVGRVSRIDAIQQQQMAVANKTQATQQLQRIESALKRIEEGLFGYCLQCGESITVPRLQVQPEATLCLACQSEREQR